MEFVECGLLGRWIFDDKVIIACIKAMTLSGRWMIFDNVSKHDKD